MMGRVAGWIRAALLREGSTRPAALMRVATMGMMWDLYASGMRLMDSLEPGRVLLGLNFWGSTILFGVGLWTRWTGLWVGATAMAIYFYGGYVLDIEPWTHHHNYMLQFCVLLLGLSPCGRSYSVDRWLEVRRAEREGRPPAPERGPMWAITLICWQVSLLYFWGAYNKSYYAFLIGSRMENYFMYYYTGSDRPDALWWKVFMVASGAGSIFFEYLLAFGLWVRRWQVWLIPAGILFHLGIYYTLPVSTFSLTMAVLYLAFLDPDRVHRFIDRISGVPSTV